MHTVGTSELIAPYDPMDYLRSTCPCPPEIVRECRITVFDDYILSQTLGVSVSSSPVYDSVLAVFDRIAVEAVVDMASSSSLKLMITLQHSAEREHWMTKAIILAATPVTAGQTNILPIAYDNGSTPKLAFARIILTLSGDVAPLQAKVRATVTISDSRWRDMEDLDAASEIIIAEVQQGLHTASVQNARPIP